MAGTLGRFTSSSLHAPQEGSRRPRQRSGRAVFLIAAACTVTWLWSAHGRLLNWDEADYWGASRLGLASNALERGGLDPLTFARLAQSRLKGEEPRVPPFYREDQDPLLLRHFHPPLVVYLVVLSSLGDWGSMERMARAPQLLGALVLMVILQLLYSRMSLRPTWIGQALFLVLSTWCACSMFRDLHFHGWLAVWLAMIALTLFTQDVAKDAVSWPRLGITLGLAALTLESAVVAIALVVYRLLGQRSQLWRVLGLAAGLTALLWPGALVRMSPVKIAALYTFRLWTGGEYSSVLSRYGGHVGRILPLALSGALALAYAVTTSGAARARLTPVLYLGALYTAFLAPFAVSSGYLLPGLALLIPVACVGVDTLGKPGRSLCLAVLATAAVLAWPSRGLDEDAALRADLAWVDTKTTHTQVWADGAHVLRLYLPARAGDLLTLHVGYDGLGLFRRTALQYFPLGPEELAGRWVMLLRERKGSRQPPKLLESCAPAHRQTLVLYDCRH